MVRRRVGAVAAMLAIVVLAGCSVPAEWAIRLNADGTVDYLACYGGMESVSVDYKSAYFDEQVVEWEIQTIPTPADDFSHVAKPVDVAYYGETPPNWEGAPALPAPAGWTHVSTGGGFIAREDLTVGEWHWDLNSNWEWVPEHPCDGWVIDQGGEPVKVS